MSIFLKALDSSVAPAWVAVIFTKLVPLFLRVPPSFPLGRRNGGLVFDR